MKMFAFAALAVAAIIWGTTAGAFRQSPTEEPLTMEGIVADWSITETGAAPGWYVSSAHARMW